LPFNFIVHRVKKELQKTKRVEMQRNGHYVLTQKGVKEAERTPEGLPPGGRSPLEKSSPAG
jgi:hypothetical protein